MSFSTAIVSIASATSGITNIVSTRIRPVNGVQGEDRPFVVYEITADEDPAPHAEGASEFRRTSFNILSIADTYAGCKALADAVHARFKFYSGTIASRDIAYIRFEDESDIEQGIPPGQEKPAYLKSQSFRSLHKASS